MNVLVFMQNILKKMYQTWSKQLENVGVEELYRDFPFFTPVSTFIFVYSMIKKKVPNLMGKNDKNIFIFFSPQDQYNIFW